MTARTYWTDEEMLEALQLRENEGWTMQAIADHLGRPRNAVIGVTNRIKDAHQPCEAKKPENRDGGMPERWWAMREETR